MDLLQPVIRPYAWGSRYGIAAFQGRPVPAPGPEAELWMGAHPSAPSGLAGRPETLDEVIAADPDRELGGEIVARFGPRLPFLLKILAADKALSVQLHPSRAQAQAGFRAENERGLPPGDPARNYVDDWPKPELLCAVTPFEVLGGLRSPAEAAAILRALEVDQLRPLVARLEAAADDRVLGEVLASVLQWPAPGELAAEVAAACARQAPGSRGPYAVAARVAADFPRDPGVVAVLLMRHAVLQPGQAVFMPAGGLHAYLKGTGIELLANSDNVVRAGLTGKHIDVPELLKLLDPAVEVPILSPVVLAEGVTGYDTPAPEFRLHVLDTAGQAVDLPGTGPRIVLCAQGAAELRDEQGEALKVAHGESCFISAADGRVRCAGSFRAFVASPGSAIQDRPSEHGPFGPVRAAGDPATA
jgi:mannose-6-phosphate isomerase